MSTEVAAGSLGDNISSQAFRVYEIRENVLLNLQDARDLFVFQRVNSEWHATISNNRKLQIKMMLMPEPKLAFVQIRSLELGHRICSFVQVNPFLQYELPRDQWFNSPGSRPSMQHPRHSSYYHMLFSNPLAFELELSSRAPNPAIADGMNSKQLKQLHKVRNDQGITLGDIRDLAELLWGSDIQENFEVLEPFTLIGTKNDFTSCEEECCV